MTEGPSRHFYLVDDDPAVLRVLRSVLERNGDRVTTDRVSEGAVERIVAARPDCVVLDLMMPGVDGLALCRGLRDRRELDSAKVVFLTGKDYAADRARAMASGADGFFVKPVEPGSFSAELDGILADRLLLTFWGCRGTLPVPGPNTLKYGGNTPCVTLELPDETLFIFDAGTGIRELSNRLVAEQRERIDGKILITHPHWDHINALPFFAPFYASGHVFEVFGAAQGQGGLRQLLLSQMDGVYFPVTEREFSARLEFRELGEGQYDIGGVRVSTMLLRHPGACLGYRVDYHGRSICYVTDNELDTDPARGRPGPFAGKLADFVAEADALIIDTTYLDEEYPARTGWGHSSVGQVVELADRAGVGDLFLFHHDPDQTDADIDRKLEAARGALAELESSTRCHAPAEREQHRL